MSKKIKSPAKVSRAKNVGKLWLHVGETFRIPVADLEGASREYQVLREAHGLGASEFPEGQVWRSNTTADETVFSRIATVSYNGRVWSPRVENGKRVLLQEAYGTPEPVVPGSETKVDADHGQEPKARQCLACGQVFEVAWTAQRTCSADCAGVLRSGRARDLTPGELLDRLKSKVRDWEAQGLIENLSAPLPEVKVELEPTIPGDPAVYSLVLEKDPHADEPHGTRFYLRPPAPGVSPVPISNSWEKDARYRDARPQGSIQALPGDLISFELGEENGVLVAKDLRIVHPTQPEAEPAISKVQEKPKARVRKAKDPKPVLDPKALYLGDNGRCFCGSCAGYSAKFTGRDLSGQRVHRLTLAEVEWAKGSRDGQEGVELACEDCKRGFEQ